MRRTFGWFLLGASVLATPAAGAADPAPFAWKDGDRVVLIGDTFVERDQKYGYLETRVTVRNPDKAITFRNLGWSGDTVFGHARAGFGTQADGFRQLREHVLSLKPTVLIVGYGMAESFGGEAGLPGFAAGLNALLDAVSGAGARLILLSPVAHEDRGRPLPDPSAHNRDLRRYRGAVEAVAAARGARFIDLFEPTASAHGRKLGPLTDNGIHPTEFGHWYLASVIDRALAGPEADSPWEVRAETTGDGRANHAAGADLSDLKATPTGVRFRVRSTTLPVPPAPRGAPAATAGAGTPRVLAVSGLAPGSYRLAVDGKAVAGGDAGAWARGVRITSGPDFDQVEALRKTINAKNELYFYRWRPQNETYLFGFRKHEQGNNAREIPLFDPLVEAREKEIAAARVPAAHAYELARDGGG